MVFNEDAGLDLGRATRVFNPEKPSRAVRRWTRPQQSVFDSRLKLTVWWGANGIGKSLAIANLAKMAIAGELHWQKPRRNGRTVMIVGNTLKQIGVTLEYFFESCPKGWFRDGIRFEAGAMKGQRESVYDIIGGPGKGGKLIVGVFNSTNLAGPRAEVVISDEPLPETVHNELWPRLLGRGGRMYVTFTPTLKTATKLAYLWDLVDDEKKDYIGEIQTELTIDAVTPRGGLVDVSWMTPTEIRQLEEGLSRMEADMRMGRTRNPRLDTAYFTAWGPHLRQEWTPPKGTLVAVGIDHGSLPGAQRATLSYVSGRQIVARIHIADHYKGDGRTESEDDARGIIKMLHRNGLEPRHVDYWVGDRGHRGDRKGGVKSNIRLQEALARQMDIRITPHRPDWMSKLPRALRKMHTPIKYDGSVWDGCDLLHRAMVAERFTMSPRATCNPLDDDFFAWQGGFTDPAKDGIDSVRYGVVPLIEGRHGNH